MTTIISSRTYKSSPKSQTNKVLNKKTEEAEHMKLLKRLEQLK
jgi:hypothetical protein